MNKKIIGTIIVALLAIVGFSIYTVVNTKQIEEEQRLKSEEVAAKEGLDATPVVNEKNDAGEYVNEPNEGVKAHDFFLKCINYSFNIPDTSNIPTEVTDFQKENFEAKYFSNIEKFYSEYTSIELVEFNIQSIEKIREGKYAVLYTGAIKVDSSETQLFSEQNKSAKAIINVNDGKFSLMQFFTRE